MYFYSLKYIHHCLSLITNYPGQGKTSYSCLFFHRCTIRERVCVCVRERERERERRGFRNHLPQRVTYTEPTPKSLVPKPFRRCAAAVLREGNNNAPPPPLGIEDMHFVVGHTKSYQGRAFAWLQPNQHSISNLEKMLILKKKNLMSLITNEKQFWKRTQIMFFVDSCSKWPYYPTSRPTTNGVYK